MDVLGSRSCQRQGAQLSAVHIAGADNRLADDMLLSTFERELGV